MPKRTAASETSIRTGDYNIWDLYDATRQTTHWKTKDARILRLAEMEADHLVNVAGHLMANRYRILAFEEARYLLEGSSGAPWAGYDDVEHAWQQVLESDPVDWLQRTPLWGAIMAELVRRDVWELPARGADTRTPDQMRSEAFAAIVMPVMEQVSEKTRAANKSDRKA